MEIKQAPVQSVVAKMWRTSIYVGCVVAAVFILYTYIYEGGFSLVGVSKAVAGTAAVMIGLSFALSGIGYYFDFLDKKIAYRKYFGLVGFWLALAYSVLLLFVDPEKYFYGFFDHLGSAEVLLGLGAMCILTAMTIVSNPWGIKRLGAARWRRILHLGYLAYAFLIIRAYILEHTVWGDWIAVPSGLPPPRLVVTIFAVAVIAFRGSMIISVFLKRRHASIVAPQQQPVDSQQVDTKQ